jgi:hypothetical protein
MTTEIESFSVVVSSMILPRAVAFCLRNRSQFSDQKCTASCSNNQMMDVTAASTPFSFFARIVKILTINLPFTYSHRERMRKTINMVSYGRL